MKKLLKRENWPWGIMDYYTDGSLKITSKGLGKVKEFPSVEAYWEEQKKEREEQKRKNAAAIENLKLF